MTNQDYKVVRGFTHERVSSTKEILLSDFIQIINLWQEHSRRGGYSALVQKGRQIQPN